MKKIILIISIISFVNNFIIIAQQSYQPAFPNYSIELQKVGSNTPTGNLFIYDGQNYVIYQIGKLSNTPTYRHAFYQWNISNNNLPSAAVIDYIEISFDAQFINYQASELNYFNCILDLSDLGLNKNTLWNYSDKNQNQPIGSGIINTPPSSFVTQTHIFYNGSSFVNSFVNSVQQTNRFTLGIAWKYEGPSSGNISWYIKPLKLKVYYHIPNQSVVLDQRLSDNSQVGKLRKWEGSEIGFTPPPYITPGTPFEFPLQSTQTILGDQAVYSGEKYNYWNSDRSDIINHHEFTITSETSELTSRFEPTKQNISLKNSLELSTVSGGNIHFKDPWLIDYPDPLYGNTLRNRGMDAPFKQRTSPFYPDYSTSYNGDVYKGVFLNQGWPNWQPPYYSVKAEAVQDIPLQQTGRTHRFYFQGWSANPHSGAEFQYPNALETPVVFKSGNTTVQANYKGTQLSSITDGFKNPGQRKLVITSYPEAYYHLVYSSMGSVWYEKAQLNYDVISPVNWQFMNNQKAINSHLANSEAKSPSIDYVYATREIIEENYFVYITYQSKKPDGKYEIRLCKFNKNGSKIFDIPVYESSLIDYNSVDCTPVVAVSRQPMINDPIKLIVLWKRPTEGSATAGLYYTAGFDRGNYIEWTDSYPDPVKIPLTDANSSHPSLAVYKLPNESVYYHIAFQQGTTQIKYSYIIFGVNGSTPQDPVTISSGSGSYLNITPSITVSNSSANGLSGYDSPKIVWCSGDEGTVFYRYRPNMSTTKWSPIYMYIENDDVQNPVISGPKYDQRGIDDKFYFGWSWLVGYYKSYVSTENLSQKRSMPYKGRDLQIATVGEGWEGFGYVVLDNVTRTTAPIVFENKWVDGLLSKINSNISAGRSGTVIKNDAEFYFAFGDIKLNDNPLEFNLLSDTTIIETIEDLNNFLQSQPVSVSDNDILTYSVFYGLKDSLSAGNNLSNSDSVKFSIEIVDAATQQVLNVLDEVVQIKNSLTTYENLSYQLSMQGIGQREIIMRLKAENNFNSEYSLANIFSFNQAFSKNRIKQLKWNDENIPDHFSLEQNYPNPFNPVTVISWQSPVGSHQTLKVYDVLGNEVATLVDEYREAGRYKVEFDAGKLASGVYIYKIQAGDFESSKKMMVIK